MAIERNNTALEFEAMLRRHLKSGGAPVAACAGFDSDTASAYLEGALGKSPRARFETHLAGCAACRCHLIELARLSHLATQEETRPVAVAGPIPVWVRWKENLASTIDHLVWSWKWQTFGAAGAAFAVLIAALSFQLWRQSLIAAPDHAVTQPGAIAMLPTVSASPSPEQPPESSAESNAADTPELSRSRAQSKVPKPEVGPKQSVQELALLPTAKSLNLPPGRLDQAVPFDFNRPVLEGVPESSHLRFALQQNLASQQPLAGNSDKAEHQVAAKIADQSASDGAKPPDGSGRRDVVAQITPPPEYNPMIADSEKPPPPRNKGQNEKAESQQAKSKWRERVMGFLPDRKPEPERKPSISKEDDESVKPLTVRIRNKVFRFEQGMWIDQVYKPEIMRWRVLKLTRGSKEYDQVLADDPRLKEFFDHGPILVVWGDKIYRVGQ